MSLHLHAELYQGRQPIERILADGTIETVVPPLDFERMWQA